MFSVAMYLIRMCCCCGVQRCTSYAAMAADGLASICSDVTAAGTGAGTVAGSGAGGATVSINVLADGEFGVAVETDADASDGIISERVWPD